MYLWISHSYGGTITKVGEVSLIRGKLFWKKIQVLQFLVSSKILLQLIWTDSWRSREVLAATIKKVHILIFTKYHGQIASEEHPKDVPEGSDTEDIWDRVIIPLIQMKYINIKGNMNNDLKKIYMSVYCVLHNPIAVWWTNQIQPPSICRWW